MASKKKAAKKTAPPKPSERTYHTQLICEPVSISIPVDLAFIAATLPRFRVKDLVVIAMAMGGRILMAEPGQPSLAMVIEINLRDLPTADQDQR